MNLMSKMELLKRHIGSSNLPDCSQQAMFAEDMLKSYKLQYQSQLAPRKDFSFVG
jgi:hypothetical protein